MNIYNTTQQLIKSINILALRVDQLEKEKTNLYIELNKMQNKLARIEEQHPSLDVNLGNTKGLYESVFGKEMGNGLYESIFGDSKGVNG